MKNLKFAFDSCRSDMYWLLTDRFLEIYSTLEPLSDNQLSKLEDLLANQSFTGFDFDGYEELELLIVKYMEMFDLRQEVMDIAIDAIPEAINDVLINDDGDLVLDIEGRFDSSHTKIIILDMISSLDYDISKELEFYLSNL